MKDTEIANKLLADNIISKESFNNIETRQSSVLFSLNFELKALLYMGILLLSTGLGIIIYKNIDSIGHMAIIFFIAAVSVGCFVYCIRKSIPYSNIKVDSPGILFDYILLFGCLTFITFLGYLQYQYSVFGVHNDWVPLFSAFIFFVAAYYFDHLGVLSLAITTFAAYIGIAITPLELIRNNDFSIDKIIYYGLALGLFLVGLAWILSKRHIKKHFTFTYINFAAHLVFVFCLAGLFKEETPVFFISAFFAAVSVMLWQAYSEKSFYFLLISVLYGYIGLSYLVIRFLITTGNESELFLIFFYSIGSSVGVILYLINASKKLKAA